MIKNIELTILMPCLNEEKTVGICVEKAQEFLIKNKVNGEIIVADNGSTDRSQKIAEEKGAVVIEVNQKGYGNALKGGISTSSGKYIIMGDADDSYDFSNLNTFLEKLREGYDLVMGNRFAGGIKPGAMPFLHRYLGNPILSGIGRIFFKTPSRDFHCGLRGFNKVAIEKIDLQTTGMEFASEMVIKASINNLKVCEVPTILSPDGRDMSPHLRSWRDGWRHLRFLLSFSPRWLFLYPGLLLMIIGLIFSIWITIIPIQINQIVFDIHSLLLFNLLFLVGFNMVLFSIQTHIYASRTALIPSKMKYEKLIKYFSLEKGLLLGFIIMLIGFIVAVVVYFEWSKNQFNYMDTRFTMRQFIPAIFSIIMGSQIVFSSFFISILGIKTRKIDM
jgi:glycosyltransferase involved in cell wall biosynthesis